MDGEGSSSETSEDDYSSSSSADGDSSDIETEDDELDYTNSSYHIATTPVTNRPNLEIADDPWVLVNQDEDEDGDVECQLDKTIVTGLQHVVGCTSPRDFFDLFYTNFLWDMIITNTNKCARDKKIKKWKNVDKKTMQGFFSIIFNMGLTKKNQIHDYWSVRFSQSTPWFRTMMARDHFKRILRAFRIVDNATLPPYIDPSYRPSMRLRPLLDFIDTVCMHYLRPSQDIAIDESLVAGKTRNPIRQYLPNKHHARWGTKVWLLADSSTAYMLKCYVYEGAKYDPSSGIAGQGYDVVLRLLEMGNCFDQSHHLLTDNLFTSYQVARYLLDRQTYITGTMRRNQTWHLPKEIINAKPSIGESVYYRQGGVLAMSYRQKKSQNKPVIMLSTFKGAYSVPHRKKDDVSIPAMVDTYNQSMGGVDSSDQVMYSYMSERKSRNWAKKVVFSLLSRLLMNSYVIYSKAIRTPKRRIEYIKDIVDSLALSYRAEEPTNSLPNVVASSSRGVETMEGKKQLDCFVCSSRSKDGKGRKRARTRCTYCKKGLHGTCLAKHKC